MAAHDGSSFDNAVEAPLFRRNGLKVSCEPCRKSKHRCDHLRPICRRCQTRGIAERCTYHPAPMRGTSAPKRKKGLDKQPSTPLPPLADSGAISTPPLPSTNSRIILSPDTVGIPESAEEDVGFLGSTAFNAVFTENQDHIPLPNTTGIEAGNSTIQLHAQLTASRTPNPRRGNSDALFVLEILRDVLHLERIVNRWSRFDRWWSLIGPWLQDCQKSIRQDIFDKHNLTCDTALSQVVEMLHANTAAPLRMPNDVRFCDFISYYTGDKIRWEAIGVFLTACGLTLFGLPCDETELDFAGHLEQDKQRLMLRLLEASDACLSFCSEALHDTDLSFWLMMENCTYASQVLGDAHYTVWRKLGDLSTAIFARGLHAVGQNSHSPFWLREMRRRALGFAYAMDKTLSTFVGRPPRISKRYCNIELPLDLEYDELALEGDALSEACSKLDAMGWNHHVKSPEQRSSACLRLWVQEAIVREEVLELCLGPLQDNLREKAQNIIKQCKDLYGLSPLSLQYSPDMWLTQGSERSFEVVRRYLDITYKEFMLRRMLVRRLQDDPTELVILAHKILAAVIEARHMRAINSNSACMAWLVVLNGLPAAAVLALELLQLNVRGVTHAKIKQDLCVFISYLKWVHVPGEGNYSLADRGRETLQHIMDIVLAPETPRTDQLGQRKTEAAANSNHDSTSTVDDLGVYDFSWLDAEHFDQDFWNSLNSLELPTVT